MSNVTKRILVGVIAAPVLLLLVYERGLYFLVFSMVICALGLWELYTMFEKKRFFILKRTSILFSLLMMVVAYYSLENLIYLMIVFYILIISFEVFRRDKRNPKNPFIAVFGVVYITVPLIMLNLLLKIPGFNIVLYCIILIWVTDTFAYFGGKAFGKRQLSDISPSKTIEGALIGLVMAVIVSFVYRYFFVNEITVIDAVIMGFAIGIFGPVGDLFESILKRYVDQKDSSNIIPGHGGVLDRFDSLIFISPFIYIYYTYIRFFIN
ncbi:MAG: phosphatidate cytidylyltransferase [Ignavibacteriae bacterium]|nr:phosphatidate cytidylyltransferase [Ignavibacteriota bacterium]